MVLRQIKCGITVDKIHVLEDKKIEIHFSYDETIEILNKLSSHTGQISEIKEVV